MFAQTTTEFKHGFSRLIHDFLVVCQGFLGLGGELHVGARQMNQDGGGAFGDTSAARLLEPVLPPIHRFDSFGQQTATLLVHERDAIGEAKHFDRLVRWHALAEDEPHFHLERVALRDGRCTRHGGDEARVDGFGQPLLDEQFLDGRKAIRRGVEQLYRLAVEVPLPLKHFDQGAQLLCFEALRFRFFLNFGRCQEFLGGTGRYAREVVAKEHRHTGIGGFRAHSLELAKMNAVGVRFDALHFSRQAVGNTGPMVLLTVRIDERDGGVRVDDACHSEVLVHALAPALVLSFHACGDFQPVFFERPVRQLPDFSPFVLLGGFVFSRVQPDVHHGGGCFRSNF